MVNPMAPLPGLGLSMQDLMAMFQQLMAQQQGSARIPRQPLPRTTALMPPTPPSYMDAAPPPPPVGNQAVPKMPAPQLSAITEMMKNTQNPLSPPTQPPATPTAPAARKSSPNVTKTYR